LPGFLASTSGRVRSQAIGPAKIKPRLSMLTIAVGSNAALSVVISVQALTKAGGLSIRLVISLKVIPGIG